MPKRVSKNTIRLNSIEDAMMNIYSNAEIAHKSYKLTDKKDLTPYIGEKLFYYLVFTQPRINGLNFFGFDKNNPLTKQILFDSFNNFAVKNTQNCEISMEQFEKVLKWMSAAVNMYSENPMKFTFKDNYFNSEQEAQDFYDSHINNPNNRKEIKLKFKK